MKYQNFNVKKVGFFVIFSYPHLRQIKIPDFPLYLIIDSVSLQFGHCSSNISSSLKSIFLTVETFLVCVSKSLNVELKL